MHGNIDRRPQFIGPDDLVDEDMGREDRGRRPAADQEQFPGDLQGSFHRASSDCLNARDNLRDKRRDLASVRKRRDAKDRQVDRVVGRLSLFYSNMVTVRTNVPSKYGDTLLS